MSEIVVDTEYIIKMDDKEIQMLMRIVNFVDGKNHPEEVKDFRRELYIKLKEARSRK